MLIIKNFTWTPSTLLNEHSEYEFPTTGLIPLIGPNGAGKSSFLRWLVFGEHPKVSKNSKIIFQDLKNQTLAKNFQFFSWLGPKFMGNPEFRVIEHVLLGLFPWTQGSYSSRHVNHSLDFLQKLGLSHLKDKKIDEISSGEQQLTELARGFVGYHKVVCLDEPLTYLDAKNAKLMMDILESMSKDRLIFMATHHLHLLGEFSKNALVFDGSMQASPMRAPIGTGT